MTTQDQTITIDRLLIEKRGAGSKSEAARAIGVSRQIYDQWEAAFAIPGFGWVKPLGDYLEMSTSDTVMCLYRSWKAQRGGKLTAHNPRYRHAGWRRPQGNRPPGRSSAA